MKYTVLHVNLILHNVFSQTGDFSPACDGKNEYNSRVFS